jgi:hypothetical protein
VAVLHYPENATGVVLRGPVNPLACFHVERSTLHVFFSHLDDFVDLKVAPVSINWDGITAQVVGGDYLTNETAIKEIDSLECGESIECRSNGRLRHMYWDPRSFLEERAPRNFDQAIRTTRRAVDYSVSALSSRHDRILERGKTNSQVLTLFGIAMGLKTPLAELIAGVERRA